MRRGWRVLRQHGRRGRSGQVSAVATVLALMLFVSFLSTFVLGQLDAQMSQKEFQHELQVENQMLRFQDSLLESAAALSANGSTYASSPITLNSGGVPPFGTPSSGALQPDFTVSSLSAGLGLANVTPAPPLWNSGSPCFAGGNGTCSGQNGPALYWNFSGNHSTVTPGVNGCGASGCTIIYNISGSFDTITLLLRGNNLGNVLFVVFGNWDNMTLNYQGSCNNHRLVDVFMVGTNDTYKLNVGGCASGMGASLSTIFIGSLGIVCPYGNGVSTDRFLGASWGSSNGVSQNLTWRNAIGYVSAPHTIPTNGGRLPDVCQHHRLFPMSVHQVLDLGPLLARLPFRRPGPSVQPVPSGGDGVVCRRRRDLWGRERRIGHGQSPALHHFRATVGHLPLVDAGQRPQHPYHRDRIRDRGGDIAGGLGEHLSHSERSGGPWEQPVPHHPQPQHHDPVSAGLVHLLEWAAPGGPGWNEMRPRPRGNDGPMPHPAAGTDLHDRGAARRLGALPYDHHGKRQHLLTSPIRATPLWHPIPPRRGANRCRRSPKVSSASGVRFSASPTRAVWLPSPGASPP